MGIKIMWSLCIIYPGKILELQFLTSSELWSTLENVPFIYFLKQVCVESPSYSKRWQLWERAAWMVWRGEQSCFSSRLTIMFTPRLQPPELFLIPISDGAQARGPDRNSPCPVGDDYTVEAMLSIWNFISPKVFHVSFCFLNENVQQKLSYISNVQIHML